ncbi:MAG: hypothetical protein PHP02_09335 [Eubacteriales bacterium]|nr:hypothetical protein [Eubacteriales bacterium]
MAKQVGWHLGEPAESQPPTSQQSRKAKQERREAGQAVWEKIPGRPADWVSESKSLWVHPKLWMLQTHSAAAAGKTCPAEEEAKEA